MTNRFVRPLIPAALLLAAPSLLSAAAATGGRAIYRQRCEPCHAADGSGATAMGRSFKLRNLRSPEVQKRTDADLTDVIAKGRNGRMPAFGESLGAENIKKVVGYLRTMAKK